MSVTGHRHQSTPSRVHAYADGALLDFQGTLHNPSEDLAIVDRALDFVKAQGCMGPLRYLIVQQRIGSDFEAALRAGPGFGGRHELRAYALPAAAFDHEPPFDVANRTRRIAAFRMRPQPYFQEAHQGMIIGLGYQNRKR